MKFKLIMICIILICALPLFWFVWQGLGVMFPQVAASKLDHFFVFATWVLTISAINQGKN